MQVFIASDHTGFQLKQVLIPYIEELGHTVTDCGASDYTPGDDYPDVVGPCAKRIMETADAMGVVIGGSGHGEAMVANREHGVRAATFYGPRQAQGALEAENTSGVDGYDIVRVSRMHNDANVLSLGARFVSEAEAKEAVRVFLATPFSGEERHKRRIAKF